MKLLGIMGFHLLWRLRWVLLALLLGAVGWWLWPWVLTRMTAQVPPALPVTLPVVAVQRAVEIPWTETVRLSGRSEAPAAVAVRAPVGGVLTDWGVAVGDRVAAGDVLGMVAPQLRDALGTAVPVVAPVDGVVGRLNLRAGERVGVAVVVAEVVPTAVVVLVGDVSPDVRQQLTPGAVVQATLANGEQVPAVLQDLVPAPGLAAAARGMHKLTLRLEGTRAIPVGMVTSLAFPVGMTNVVAVRRASMDASMSRVLGVVRNPSGTVVASLPVQVVDATSTTAWVQGLPDSALILTGSNAALEVGKKVEIGTGD